MNLLPLIFLLGFGLWFATVDAVADEGNLQLKAGDQELIGYQAKPLSNPEGGERFKGSNFIHPLKTPSGFVVTETQPSDHPHHFGLWWPWKFLEKDGRQILCWELQKGEGIVEARESQVTPEGFTAKSVYLDRKAPNGPEELVEETLVAKVSDILESPVRGYNLDLKITHRALVDEPITVPKYRYSGFSYRGTLQWTNQNSSVLTSEGKNRADSNFSRAKWVRIEGETDKGERGGLLLMSDTRNRDYPERLRTWNQKSYDGAIFINFNSVQDKPWVFEPGKEYTRNFRVFVYDGTLSPEQAEKLWEAYVRDEPAT